MMIGEHCFDTQTHQSQPIEWQHSKPRDQYGPMAVDHHGGPPSTILLPLAQHYLSSFDHSRSFRRRTENYRVINYGSKPSKPQNEEIHGDSEFASKNYRKGPYQSIKCNQFCIQSNGHLIKRNAEKNISDQLTFILRYVTKNGEPVERFLRFVPNIGHKAEEIIDATINIFEDLDLDVSNCRGQSYDNASNCLELTQEFKRVLRV
ncbi:unnamed protein product [Bemisia tabaci]|uniref:DUF4371 domain-containing protein n=1 Tax=Bemisia tabaci TaxID=7038 RepID=A0A9P0AHX8_BEMTA|nr:unnamed protein product [Bemisia tabaci]